MLIIKFPKSFIIPLHGQPIIFPEEAQRSEFMDTVFGNMDRLLESHRHTLSLLQSAQREQWPIVDSVASIIGDMVRRTSQIYETYVANYPIAQYYIDREAGRNRQFKKFLEVSVHITLDETV